MVDGSMPDMLTGKVTGVIRHCRVNHTVTLPPTIDNSELMVNSKYSPCLYSLEDQYCKVYSIYFAWVLIVAQEITRMYIISASLLWSETSMPNPKPID